MNKKVDLKGKPFCLDDDQADWVLETLDQMTLEEKAGQLFCVLAQPDHLEETLHMVRDIGAGGVLFRPVLSKEELREQFRILDDVAKYPLLKASNLEEGGNGAARDGLRFATQMGAAAAGKIEDVRRLAYVCAKEGQEMGINLTFSPVSDIDYNFRNPITNVRTFGSHPDDVREDTAAYVRELQKAGIAACAKHFPGDGVDYRDQHLHPTCNSLSADQWYRTYGMIYRNMINEGLLCVMAAHIMQPALERQENPAVLPEEILPASLNPVLLKKVLRGKLGFNGLIITDATIMNGFSMAMERKKAIPFSIAAGCDMLCFSLDLEEDLEYMLDGIRSGILTEERLDEAVLRILALKAWIYHTPHSILPEADFHSWAQECADRAVTLVKDRKHTLPVFAAKYDCVRLICFGEDHTPDGSLKNMVKMELGKHGLKVEEYNPETDHLSGPGRYPERLLTLYISNFEAVSNRTSVRLDWSLNHALGTPRFPREEDYIFVSFGNPYHLSDVPRVPVYINAYTANKYTVKAVADRLFGQAEFVGQSPVDAFCGLEDARL